MRHLLSLHDLGRSEIDRLYTLATEMESGRYTGLLRGRILWSLFYEPSTRTRVSFESAMLRLGGSVVTVADRAMSSFSKGETIADNTRVLSSYCDIIAIRHPEVGSAALTAQYSSVPVINAGDGIGEHPTQALLDGYTILRERWGIDGVRITFVGDLRYGRTVHSLVLLLSLFDGVSFTFVSPEELGIPTHLKTLLDDRQIPHTESRSYETYLDSTDILYVTRIQRERFSDPSLYEQIMREYQISYELMSQHPEITIMHPLPRVSELPESLDSLSGAAYFRQAAHGVAVRMAIIYDLLAGENMI